MEDGFMAQALILAFFCGAFLYFASYLFSKSIIFSFVVSIACLCILYYFNFSDQVVAVSLSDVANNFTTAILKISFISLWLLGTALMFRLMDSSIEWA
jgi:hypothetical protein